MQIIKRLYEKVLQWSRHKHAPLYLTLVSFIDSSIFPISPMVMFVPMSFAAPARTFWYAGLGTVGSMFGGMVGYLLGVFAFDSIVSPFLHWMGYETLYQAALQSFARWGFWAVLIGSFSPIPFKIFTIGAGVMQLNFPLFLLASSLGRFLRFFVVGGFILVSIHFWPKIKPFMLKLLAQINERRKNRIKIQ